MRWIGSLPFAIMLLGLSALLVIVGTIIEAKTDSHLLAATFIYDSFFFRLLLMGYFFNILCATLNRRPFKRHHLPFITTHIGLLMLLAGVFCKTHFGMQGFCLVKEGTATDEILLPNTYALHLEERDTKRVVGIKKGHVGPVETDNPDLKLTILEWIPHAKEELVGWIDEKQGHLIGFPPLPVYEWQGEEIPISLKTPHTTLSLLQVGNEKGIQEKLQDHHLALVKTDKETLLLTGKERHILSKDHLLVFDKGFGGYGYSGPLLEGIEWMTPIYPKHTATPPPQKLEERMPAIRLLIEVEGKETILSLGYDKEARKLRWPTRDGQLLVRFAPLLHHLPFEIRMHQAHRIDHDNTTVPKSFEGVVSSTGKPITKMAMNKVYQRDGYRFYLSNLHTADQRATIVGLAVNRDPAKVFLTYPGAIICVIGMIALYLRRRYA